MKKIIKLVFATAMLLIMLYAVTVSGIYQGKLNPSRLFSSMLTGIQNTITNFSSTASSIKVGEGTLNGQPIPILSGDQSTPTQDTQPATTESVPSDEYASTGIQGLQTYTYGRTLLSDNEKMAYDQIQKGLLALDTKVTLTSSISPVSMEKVVQYLISDHPEAFYLNNTSMVYASSMSGARKYEVSFTYYYRASEVETMREELRQKILPIVQQANTQSDMVKKEKILHDALIKTCTYSMDAAENPESDHKAFTAYGALVEGSAVCEGYAKALKLLADSAGLHTLYVTGTAASAGSSGSHAWNIIYVGKWYQVDATFDDPVYQTASGKYVSADKKDYTYFNFVTVQDHVLGTFDSTSPFSSDSENYVTMPSLG